MSARPSGRSSASTWSAMSSKDWRQTSLTVRGEMAGKIALRSARCSRPSLRIMFCPIRRVISPSGWTEEKTSIFFSFSAMSSRRTISVASSWGT